MPPAFESLASLGADPFDFRAAGLGGKVIGALFLVIGLLIGLLFWQGYRIERAMGVQNVILERLDGTVRGFNSTVYDLKEEIMVRK